MTKFRQLDFITSKSILPANWNLALLLVIAFSLISEVNVTPPSAHAWQVPAAIPADDARAVWLAPQRRHLDSYFPFVVPTDVANWETRRGRLKQDLLVSQGLWPEPERTPLNAVVHGAITFDDYIVEKVYFESVPGFWVTGSLYRPRREDGPFPGVLCPHGHFRDGRFNEANENEIQAEFASGAESLQPNARSILQARCVHLARMGCVVFHYDMIGYADSQQIPAGISHGFAQRRPNLESPTAWGFFSPQAELRLQSIMGLQTWNSIRVLDFLLSLPTVDPNRIGVTGASGGGTQTFILGALDDRVRVAFPAVMVSTAMQGGCTCENASCLRTHAGNVEFAAMFAPRPLGLTAANDWTKEMESKGFPELKAVYAMMGKPEHVRLFPRLEFGHNYNFPSRRTMYEWFAQHLPIASADFDERPFEFLGRDRLTVYDAEHPAPPNGDAVEIQLLAQWASTSDKMLGLASDLTVPLSDEQQTRLRSGWDSIVGHREVQTVMTPEIIARPVPGTRFEFAWETVSSQPVKHKVVGQIATADSRQWLIATSDSQVAPDYDGWISQATAAGWNVLIVELSAGELSADGQQFIGNPLVNNGRRAAGYTFGYNRPLVARQTSNLLSLVGWLRSAQQPWGPVDQVALCGLTPRGETLLAAGIASPGSIDCVAINIAGFRFGQVTEFEDPQFLPGSVRYGDRDALLALATTKKVLLINSPESEWSLAKRLASDQDSAQRWQWREPIAAEQVLSQMLDWLKQ